MNFAVANDQSGKQTISKSTKQTASQGLFCLFLIRGFLPCPISYRSYHILFSITTVLIPLFQDHAEEMRSIEQIRRVCVQTSVAALDANDKGCSSCRRFIAKLYNIVPLFIVFFFKGLG